MQLNLNLNLDNDVPKILLNSSMPKILEYLPSSCVIVDIETTGFSSVNDSIIEISALRVINDKIDDEFSSLVNCKNSISPYISNLTGITSDMLLGAPDLKTVLKKFCNFINMYPIVGHNVKFDLSFINKNLKDLFNATLPNDFADTLFFSRQIYNLSSHKLTNIAKHLNIDTSNAHRALNDCYMTYHVICDMKEKVAKLRK